MVGWDLQKVVTGKFCARNEGRIVHGPSHPGDSLLYGVSQDVDSGKSLESRGPSGLGIRIMSSRAATVTARDEHEVALLATWCFFSNHGWTRMKGVDGRFGACFVSGDALVAGCDWHTWLAAKGRSSGFAAWQEPRPPVVVRTKREGEVPSEPRMFCERRCVGGRLRLAQLACSKGEVERVCGLAGAAPSRCSLRPGRSRAVLMLFAGWWGPVITGRRLSGCGVAGSRRRGILWGERRGCR